MATPQTVKSVFGLVFVKFPGRRPDVSTPERKAEFELFFNLWVESYRDIPDQRLMTSAARFMRETTKLYPDDDPFAMIHQLALPPSEIEQTTVGDCLDLIDEAVSRFGMYREADALTWLRSKSDLATAAIERIGFRAYCTSEAVDVIRGQLRMVFEVEKKRAVSLGRVVTSDQIKTDGVAQALTGPIKAGELVGSALKELEGRKAQ